MPNERYEWVNVARGIGILLVVYGHVARGVVDAGIQAGPAIGIIDFAIYTFHMPLFFFLSGIWLEGSIYKGRSDFVFKKFKTVVYPYFLYSILQGLLMIMVGKSINSPPTLSDLGAIWYQPMAQFWFLYALMACHLLAAVIWPSRRVAITVAFLIFLASPHLIGIAGKIAYSLIFYMAGAYAGRRIIRLSFDGKSAVMFAFFCFSIFMLMLWAAIGRIDTPNTPLTLPLTITGVAFIIFLAFSLRGVSLLALLGSASMTIYIFHIVAGAGTRVVLGKIGVPASFGLYVTLGTLAGIFVPLVAHIILERLQLLPLLGLGSRHRSTVDIDAPRPTKAS